MPRTKQQFGDMRESARRKIMDAAMALFAEQGYQSTSISMIAARAGISKGLMYNYFKSKEELLRSIVFTGVESITTGFDPNRDGILTHDELIHFIRESFRLVKSHPSYWKLYFLMMYQAPALDLFSRELSEVTHRYMGMIEVYFRKNNYENPELEARFFSSLLDGVCINFLFQGEGFPVEEMEMRIIKMYSKQNIKP